VKTLVAGRLEKGKAAQFVIAARQGGPRFLVAGVG